MCRTTVFGKWRELEIQQLQPPVVAFAEELTKVSIDFQVKSQREAWAQASLRLFNTILDQFHCTAQFVVVTWLKPLLAFFIVNPKVTVECEGESIAWRVTGVLFNGARNLIVRNCFELRGVQSRSGGGGATPTAPDEPAALG